MAETEWAIAHNLGHALVMQGDSVGASRYLGLFSRQVGGNPRMRLSELRAQALLAGARHQIAKAKDASEQAAQIAGQYGLLGELHQMKTAATICLADKHPRLA